LYNLTIKTFLITYNKGIKNKFYIGYDDDDSIFANKKEQDYLVRFLSIMKNAEIEFISMSGIKRGHLTVMWNRLFEKAYLDGNEYFFQCGDDINFKSVGWVDDCIKFLKSHDNIGLTGPINNNNRILTQSFVSRKHMEIMSYFFPPEILNWCCDDWINEVYKPNNFFPAVNHYCSNDGGAERYEINGNPNFKNMNQYQSNSQALRQSIIPLVVRDKNKLNNYLTRLI
jgi:hypothetical protein